MRFTDIFIKRPVLATVVSLLILIIGLASAAKLELRQYPKMTNTKIIITTVYPGASPSVVQGFVTLPIEQSVGSADGIDYMTAQSVEGASIITLYLKLNFNPNTALTDVTGKVNAVLGQLPKSIRSPSIDKETGKTMPPDLILGLTSSTLTPEQITAYASNVVRPKINSAGGVGKIQIWGAKEYAMRIWLNPNEMAKLGITPADVYQALTNNNIQAAPGSLKSKYVFTAVSANTGLNSAAQFNDLVVRDDHGHLIRIKDIGKAVLSAQNLNSQVYFDGKPAVFLGIDSAPGTNPLTVVGDILKLMPQMQKAMPPGVRLNVVYNSTLYISKAIEEVIKTILEATLIVVLVIFAFIGTFRSMMIPVLAIPLSLVGVCFLMHLMGFSLNLLTMLAMVLSIGLVVDDAIVVLENIYRHVEEGMVPFDAAIKGAREIAGPVIVMTTTLAAVFAPIGFIGGLTGALFKEFAFTLAAAVIISGIIALTFSPMLCSKVLSRSLLDKPLVKKIDAAFLWLKTHYLRLLKVVMGFRPVVVFLWVMVLICVLVFYALTPGQLAPQEDESFLAAFGNGPSAVTVDYLKKFHGDLQKLYQSFPERLSTFTVMGFPQQNNIFAGMIFKPWSQRDKTTMQLYPVLQEKLANIPMQLYPIQPAPLPGTPFGLPVSFVITSTGTFQSLAHVAKVFEQKVRESGKFVFVTDNLRFDSPQMNVHIDRERAAALGISMSQIAEALSVMVGDDNVNYFDSYGYSFEVIPQMWRRFRNTSTDIKLIHVRTASGKLVPLSSIVSFSMTNEPFALNQFQQLNAVTISALPTPGQVTLGEGLQIMRRIAATTLLPDMSYNYSGQSRQFMQEGDAMIFAILLAIIIIYLVLAAQFESFRDPLIILLGSMPLTFFGALLPLFLGADSLNIYTKIGLVALIGLISKHGILMVEFANKLRAEGLPIIEAIEQAAAIRLRPVLMTTLSMVFGVMPLVLASGAGAASRYSVGLVIASGMTIGTVFTLFVLPVVYSFLAQKEVPHSPTSSEALPEQPAGDRV